MSTSNTSPRTLSRAQGEEPHWTPFKQVLLVARAIWEIKYQCVSCKCMDVTNSRSSLCPECLAYNPNTTLLTQ